MTDIGVLEIRTSRQNHIRVRHAVGHRDFDAGHKYVLSLQRPLHPILVWMDDQRVVVVDEQGLDWRLQIVIEEQPTDVKNIDRPRLRRHEIGARQSIERLRKCMTCAADKATSRNAELACQRWQSGDGAQPGAAVLIALESVPPGDPRVRGLLYQRARVRMASSSTPHISAARSGG